MQSIKSARLIGLVAVALLVTYSPIALASSSESGALASQGAAVTNPGFNVSGDAQNKAIYAIQGKAQPGIPNFAITKTAAGTSNGISYRGGPVMVSTDGIKINLIWYGNWTNTLKTSIITNMLSNLGGSSYFNINTTYYNGSKVKITNKVTITNQFSDTGSQGTVNLSDAQIWNIVKKQSDLITSGPNPIANPDAVTLVLTSSNVTKSGFLTNYCGWHSVNTIGTTPVKFSFVGDPGNNLACAYQSVSPNGDMGADAMVSVIAHEIVEAATDPQLNAWYDNRGYENADKCAWKFGAMQTATNGSKYNITLGGMNFLIQQNWLNALGGLCTMSYTP